MHKPVLFQEVLEALNVKSGGKFIDATVGFGGHTLGILQANSKNIVLGFDWDRRLVALSAARLTEAGVSDRCKLVVSNYTSLKEQAELNDFRIVDGILIDLGFSSAQLDDPSRGLSFQKDGPLDMRYSQDNPLTAERILNSYSEERLEEIFRKYGEERFARQIARGVLFFRKTGEMKTTTQLSQVIESVIPGKVRYKASDSKRRIFQALRIEVNHELENISKFLPQALDLLRTGGRLAVISFHSLEDRIIKQFFVQNAKSCICPKEVPVCVCNNEPSVKIITKKPIVASEAEIEENSRSASAKMRVAEKI
jgi:16S rRNA (cytosine1402-N4)-methyltransferase